MPLQIKIINMKTILYLCLSILPSFCCFATSNTCERLASFQANVNAQRTTAAALIANNNLSDSVKNKPYCVFYMNGCRGIGGWFIAVDNGQIYHVYYTDSFVSAKENLYKTVFLPNDNEDMLLLFSQKTLTETNMKLDHGEWRPTYYYFGLYDTKGNLSFDWNQSLWFHDVQSQKRIIRVCMKFIMPFIV